MPLAAFQGGKGAAAIAPAAAAARRIIGAHAAKTGGDEEEEEEASSVVEDSDSDAESDAKPKKKKSAPTKSASASSTAKPKAPAKPRKRAPPKEKAPKPFKVPKAAKGPEWIAKITANATDAERAAASLERNARISHLIKCLSRVLTDKARDDTLAVEARTSMGYKATALANAALSISKADFPIVSGVHAKCLPAVGESCMALVDEARSRVQGAAWPSD